MRKLNFFLALIAISLSLILFIQQKEYKWNQLQNIYNIFSGSKTFSFDDVDRITKTKLHEPYSPTPNYKIQGLDGISYDDYRQIVFKPEIAIWKNLALPFQLQFFHPGHIYSNGIKVFEIIDEVPREIIYDASRFDFGTLKLPDNFAEESKNLRYTGFRVHYPINAENSLEEFIVFQGSSYFRISSKNQVYGLSARGLAINTGLPEKEEFPIFDRFYIRRPKKNDTSIQIFATLNSESVVGTYEFLITPGEPSEAEVKAKIYLRKKIKRLGFAPLTSMYLYGESDNPIRGNVHPEVHDSDGLLIEKPNSNWEWRPLINPKQTTITKLPLDNPIGYGLIQRDRKFKSYQDEIMKYHLRPSAWVTPTSQWGKGNLYLLEIATYLDSDDNIGVFWEPIVAPSLNIPFEYSYRLTFQDLSPNHHKLGKVSSFFKGNDPLYPNQKIYTLYFRGDIIKEIPKDSPPIPVIANSKIDTNNIRYKMEKISELDQWRLTIHFVPVNDESEWQIKLKSNQTDLTETWIYRDGLSK
ncbi:glucan biosynthesis protein [Leptospira sp. 96542]|nr:glucan biosynthesis protein [Leptospira sp. 96542]